MGFLKRPNPSLGDLAGWVPWALLAFLIPIYIFATASPGFGVYHDDGVYIATARSIANGEGYRIGTLPGNVAQTKYPFLYPVLLSLFWAVLPALAARILAFKLVSLLFAGLWAHAIYRLSVRMGLGSIAARWICLAVTGSGYVIFAGTAVLPDTLFAYLLTEALIQLRLIEEGDERLRRAGWTGLVAGLALLTRALGLAFFASAALFLAGTRRYRQCALFVVIAAGLYAPWVLWQNAHGAPADPVLAYYTKACYQAGSIRSIPINQAVEVLMQNAIVIAGSVSLLMDLTLTWTGPPAVAVGIFLFAAWFCFRDVSRRKWSTALFAVSYIALLWLWVFPPYKYMLVVLPLFAIWIARGVTSLTNRPARIALSVALASITTLCCIANGVRTLDDVRRSQAASFNSRPLDDYRLVARLSGWIREHTPPDAVIAANNDPLIGILSDRKSVRGWTYDPYDLLYAESPKAPVGTLSQFRDHVLTNRIAYIVVTPSEGFADASYFLRNIGSAVARCPGALTLAWHEDGYAIFQTNPAAMSGCAVDHRWASNGWASNGSSADSRIASSNPNEPDLNPQSPRTPLRAKPAARSTSGFRAAVAR